MNKDNVLNGYKVFSDKLDERAMDLTLRQYQELETLLGQAWRVIERRKTERRTI